MEEESSPIILDGISLWRVIRAWWSHDTSRHPTSPSPLLSGALQPISPWQRGRSAAPCVCACAHVRKRSSSSELNSGRTWYSLDMGLSHISAPYYYILCKKHPIFADKGKKSINIVNIYSTDNQTLPLNATSDTLLRMVFIVLKILPMFIQFFHKPTQRH